MMRYIPAEVETICLILDYLILAVFFLFPLGLFVIRKKRPKLMPWWAVLIILPISSYVLINLFWFLKYLSGWDPGGPEVGFALVMGWLYLPLFSLVFYYPLYLLILLISRLTGIRIRNVMIVVSILVVLCITGFGVYCLNDNGKRHITSYFSDIRAFDKDLISSGIVVDNADVVKIEMPSCRFEELQRSIQNKGYSNWIPLSTLEAKNFQINYENNTGLIYSVSPQRRTDGKIPVAVYDEKNHILYLVIAQGVSNGGSF